LNNHFFNIIFISILILSLLSGLLWYFFFSIYEIRISVTPDKVVTNSTNPATIKVIAVNLLGREVPFRKTPFEFKFIENGNIVEARYDKSSNLLYITPKNQTGKVKIQITSRYSLFPNIISIQINSENSLKRKSN